ncbi:MAG: DUF1015 domain-containing protein [Clostridia bacterium]|nr:DUF1015 domain-containing protein [Clostridia bacterium]
MAVFASAEFLIPEERYLDKWAVIACDQFTSQPEYWREAGQTVGSAPSALNIIFPEAFLGEEGRIEAINAHMRDYLAAGFLRRYPDSYIYVERTLLNGTIRRGIVGVIDLEAYDHSPRARTPIRATERTVVERIPPRVKIRENAPMETSHVLLLCDDRSKSVIEETRKGEKLYDFDLMLGGGHIAGWLITGEEARRLEKRIRDYEAEMDARYAGTDPIYYAVGDGNHSLATAKRCWERDRKERWAMVELENIHDEAQGFEPIHRVVKGRRPEEILRALEAVCAPGGYPVTCIWGKEKRTVTLNPALGKLPVGIVQTFLDQQEGITMDYIHGEEAAARLAEAPDTLAILLPAIPKEDLFPGLSADGVLPRKTFSMGHAQEKRYYLECRRIGAEAEG